MLIRHFVIYETFTEVFILVVPSPALTVYMTFWTVNLLRKQLMRMNQFLWIRRFALPLKEFFLKKILFSLFLGISNSLCHVCKGPLSINMPTGLFDKSDHFVGWHFSSFIFGTKGVELHNLKCVPIFCVSLFVKCSTVHHKNPFTTARISKLSKRFLCPFCMRCFNHKLYFSHLSLSLVTTDVLQLQNRLKIIKNFWKY